MKFFISHASKDAEYGKELVKLLLYIGISKDNIVFTSQSGYDIPSGEKIFDWLKERLKEETFVIYLLSDNYYNSIACLNEMGAAWIAEKEHRTIMVPGFKVSNPNFSKGAIDPREKVIFMDDTAGITEMVDFIARNQQKDISFNQVRGIVDSFIAEINKIKKSKESEVELEEKVTDQTTTMINDIINNKYSDEELLLLNYMIETGTDTLGTGWMEEHEISDIKEWEMKEFQTGFLSENYNRAFNKFKRRNLITIDEITKHGNPKQYILKGDISTSLLNIPKRAKTVLDNKKKKYSDLPF